MPMPSPPVNSSLNNGRFTGRGDPRNGQGGRRAGAGRKPNAVKAVGGDAVAALTLDAAKTLRTLLDSEDDRIRVQAAVAILQFALGKPTPTRAAPNPPFDTSAAIRARIDTAEDALSEQTAFAERR